MDCQAGSFAQVKSQPQSTVAPIHVVEIKYPATGCKLPPSIQLKIMQQISHTAVEESTEAASALTVLGVFVWELPDAEMELFIQLGDDLKEFIIFPQLPLEIRLGIWRAALPGKRAVNLDRHLHSNVYRSYPAPISIREKRAPFPVTLYVNKESRVETLKHYVVIFPPNNKSCSQCRWKSTKPICFHRVNDTFHISRSALDIKSFKDSSGDICTWASVILKKAPELMERIEELEVRTEFIWHPSQWFGPIPVRHGERLRVCSDVLRLADFSELMKICIVIHPLRQVDAVWKVKLKRFDSELSQSLMRRRIRPIEIQWAQKGKIIEL